jgi:hypothetical protein
MKVGHNPMINPVKQPVSHALGFFILVIREASTINIRFCAERCDWN